MKMPSLSARTLLIALVSVQLVLVLMVVVVWNSSSMMRRCAVRLWDDSGSPFKALLLTRFEQLTLQEEGSVSDREMMMEWIQNCRAKELLRIDQAIVSDAKADRATRFALYLSARVHRNWRKDQEALAILERALKAPDNGELDHDLSDTALEAVREHWVKYPSYIPPRR